MKYASGLAWAVMENHGFDGVKNLPSHQYLSENAAVFTNYFATTHPSGPNYRTLACGDIIVPTEEFHGNAASIGSFAPSTVIHLTVDDIAWRHNPYYDTNATVTTLRTNGLADVNTVYNLLNENKSNQIYFGWDDGGNAHSASLDMADGNLTKLIDILNNSTWFNTPIKGLYPVFMFVWDEDLQGPNNHVFAAMYGKGIKPGLYNARHDHYDFNRTITDIFEQSPLGHGKTANPIIEAFL